MLLTISNLFSSSEKMPLIVNYTVSQDSFSKGDAFEIVLNVSLDTESELYKKGDKFVLSKFSRGISPIYYNSMTKGGFYIHEADPDIIEKNENAQKKAFKGIVHEDSTSYLDEQNKSITYKLFYQTNDETEDLYFKFYMFKYKEIVNYHNKDFFLYEDKPIWQFRSVMVRAKERVDYSRQLTSEHSNIVIKHNLENIKEVQSVPVEKIAKKINETDISTLSIKKLDGENRIIKDTIIDSTGSREIEPVPINTIWRIVGFNKTIAEVDLDEPDGDVGSVSLKRKEIVFSSSGNTGSHGILRWRFKRDETWYGLEIELTHPKN